MPLIVSGYVARNGVLDVPDGYNQALQREYSNAEVGGRGSAGAGPDAAMIDISENP